MDIGTNKKAFQINLDRQKYGTFAEIGAGQEVARRFFHVGGAAGTIAKTMSAYDMQFSDAIYGPADRYVSRVRLQTMLDHEYALLLERLDQKMGSERTFFVFADTVAARSFKLHNESHGWLGIRFQAETRGEPSQIIVHVRMLDEENVDQQEALGVIGVNLIYGAFYLHQPEKLIASLNENLAQGRMQVDMIKFSGPAYAEVDNRLMSLQLVSLGLTTAVMLTPRATRCSRPKFSTRRRSSSSAGIFARSPTRPTTCSTAPAPKSCAKPARPRTTSSWSWR